MYELKRVGPGSAARVAAFMAAVFYLLAVGGLFAAGKSGNINVASGNGAVSVALGMVLTALAGAVLGAVAALIYNLLGRSGGGLRLTFRLMETERTKDDKAK